MKLELYKKETAPKFVKVDMDSMADPIWVSSEDINIDLPCLNVDVDSFPFPPALRHILHCYQVAWESANSFEYQSDSDSDSDSDCFDEFELPISSAIDASLSVLQSACEDAVERWFIANGWSTKLCRCSA